MALSYQGSSGASDVYFDEEGRLITLPAVPSPVPDIPLPSPGEMTMPPEDLSSEMTMEPVDLRQGSDENPMQMAPETVTPQSHQTPSATPAPQAPVVPPPQAPVPAEQVQSAPAVSQPPVQPAPQPPAEPQILREPPPTVEPMQIPKALQGNPLRDPYAAIDASVGMALGVDKNQLALDTWRLKQEDAANIASAQRQAQVDQKRMEAKDRWLTQRQDYLSKYDRLTDEYINTTIDPDRWIKGKSKFERLILALGAGLGAGDRNDPVGDLIDKKVREDVELQKEALERKKTGAAMVQNSWNMAGAMMDDEDSRFVLATAMEKEKVGRELLQIASATRDPQAQIALQKRATELIENARAAKYDIADKEATRAETRRHHKATEGAAWARIKMDRENMEADMLAKGFMRDPKTGKLVRDPNWKPPMPWEAQKWMMERDLESKRSVVRDANNRVIGKVLDPKDKDDVDKRTAAYGVFMETLSKVDAFTRKIDRTYGGKGFDRWKSEDQQQYDTLVENLAVQMAKMQDPTSVAMKGEVDAAKAYMPRIRKLVDASDAGGSTKALKGIADSYYNQYVQPKLDPDFDIGNGRSSADISGEWQAVFDAQGQGSKDRSRADLLRDALAPVSPLVAGDPTKSDAIVQAKIGMIDTLDETGDGITADEATQIWLGLQEERRTGTLTPEQVSTISSYVETIRKDRRRRDAHDEMMLRGKGRYGTGMLPPGSGG